MNARCVSPGHNRFGHGTFSRVLDLRALSDDDVITLTGEAKGYNR